MGKKSLKDNAVILMSAGLGVKIIGFFYRIYIANIIGAEGMGIYHLIMPVYTLIILTMTAGISIAVSRIIAEESAKGHEINSVRIAIVSFVFVLVGSGLVCFALFLNLNFLSNHILNEPRTLKSLQLLLPCIPFIAAASAVKGYFYGKQDVVPTAISQIMEQVAKLTLILLISYRFMDRGMEAFCMMATLGMVFGELANLLVVGIIFRMRQIKVKKRPGEYIMRKREIAKSILTIAVPVSLNKLASSALAAAENILIPQCLLVYGLTVEESLEQYGRLTGMAFPLLFFPSMITMSLATALVPAISEAISRKKFSTANYQIASSIQLTLVLGFIFTTLFMCCSNDIAEIIYKGQGVGSILYLLSFTCIFIYLQQTLVGILNGLGKEKITLRNSMVGNIILISSVYFGIPVIGLKAYIIGIIVCCMIVSVLNFAAVVKTTGISIDLGGWFIRPAVASAVIIISSKYIKSLIICAASGEFAASLLYSITIGVLICSMMFVMGVYHFRDLLKLTRRQGDRFLV